MDLSGPPRALRGLVAVVAVDGRLVGEETKLSNVLLIPAWSAESLAAVTAALVGLDFSFSDAVGSTINPAWGRVLAVPVLVALLLRMKRGDIPAPCGFPSRSYSHGGRSGAWLSMSATARFRPLRLSRIGRRPPRRSHSDRVAALLQARPCGAVRGMCGQPRYEQRAASRRFRPAAKLLRDRAR